MRRRTYFFILVVTALGLGGNFIWRSQNTVQPDGLVRDLSGRSPSLTRPDYQSVVQGKQWLKPDDQLVGVVLAGQARAYPIRILQYHELVNDRLGQQPIVVWYFPPTGQTTVFSRVLTQGQSRPLEFDLGQSVGYAGPIALDKATGLRWTQTGEPLAGHHSRLDVEPFGLYRWSDWQKTFPDSTVLAQPTGFTFDYQAVPQAPIKWSLTTHSRGSGDGQVDFRKSPAD